MNIFRYKIDTMVSKIVRRTQGVSDSLGARKELEIRDKSGYRERYILRHRERQSGCSFTEPLTGA